MVNVNEKMLIKRTPGRVKARICLHAQTVLRDPVWAEMLMPPQLEADHQAIMARVPLLVTSMIGAPSSPIPWCPVLTQC